MAESLHRQRKTAALLIVARLGALTMLLIFVVQALSAAGPSGSVYLTRPSDSRAVNFVPLFGDGIGDDGPTLQAAIDLTYTSASKDRIVFIPSGTYRLGNTINIWGGVRLIGCGATRPVFLLGANTPGFTSASSRRYLFHFREGAPSATPEDAGNTTFFSGFDNLSITIAAGNVGAIAARFNVAQHAFLQNLDLNLGPAYAGVEQVGNELVNCRFNGGQFGIRSGVTSPAWPVLLMDCVFDGQTEAAIRCNDLGPTLVRCDFRNTPTGVAIPSTRIDRIVVVDCSFQNVSNAAIEVADSDNLNNQVNARNVTCDRVPRFLKSLVPAITLVAAPAPTATSLYRVKSATSGRLLANANLASATDAMSTEADVVPLAAFAAAPAPDYPALPPVSSWANAKTLGVRGNNSTDDTAALQAAITQNQIVYLPLGTYVIRDTITLRPDSILIGLHPRDTRLSVKNMTPGFTDAAAPRPLLVAPPGSTPIVTGIGFITTGTSSVNAGAVHIKWSGGVGSYLNDVYFDSFNEPVTRGSSNLGPIQSLWIESGGGILRNFWSANIWSGNGLLVDNRANNVPRKIYGCSLEHHVTSELRLRGVRDWEFYALQTEGNENGFNGIAAELEDCARLTFFNSFLYRSSLSTNFCLMRSACCALRR
jgi:Pectate lyase superfamily protein